MNLQIGDNNDDDKSNRQLMDYMVDNIDRKLNPHKYEVKKVEVKDNGTNGIVIIALIIFVIWVVMKIC